VLEIVVDAPTGSVEGVVRNAKGDAVPHVPVVLLPGPPRKQAPSIATDHDGKFRFSNIAPGEYRVYAWEYAPPQAYSNPRWLQENQTRATALTVRKGQTVNADVRLIPAR
jgi:hypothetical protein